jgi:hypothetical protein
MVMSTFYIWMGVFGSLWAGMTWYQNGRITLQYYAGVVGSQVVSGHWGIISGDPEY